MTLENCKEIEGCIKVPFPVHCPVKGQNRRRPETGFSRWQRQGKEREEMARTRTVTHNIGVVLPSDVYYGSGVYFQNCLLGVCESASMLGYNVLITTSRTRMIFQSCESLVESNRVDGMLPWHVRLRMTVRCSI